MIYRELRLNRKQCLYVEGVAAGKSRRRAALDAGYSVSSANNVGFNIERRGRGGDPAIWKALTLIAGKAAREAVQ